MARLTYLALTSLDGYVADEQGNFDWAMPDDEVHAFVNDFERPVGTYPLRPAGCTRPWCSGRRPHTRDGASPLRRLDFRRGFWAGG